MSWILDVMGEMMDVAGLPDILVKRLRFTWRSPTILMDFLYVPCLPGS